MVATAQEVSLGPTLTEEQAREIFARGEEFVVFALLQQAKMLAEQQAAVAGSSHETPATPSGMKPPFAKPTASSRGKKKPGRKKGHPGTRREPPAHVNNYQTHRADVCPECGGPLCRCAETRTRSTEEIPEVQPVVTQHTIHRDWCPDCRKKVEPVVSSALPGATLGNRVLALTAWLHYALGNTLSQIVEVFNFHLQMKVTPGGLVQMWYRLAEILYPWYEQIRQEALNSAVLHGDESGWRVNGKTHWLWCFANSLLSYFMIDRSRGSPALLKFFTQEFGGTLVSDFWGAYQRGRLRAAADVLGALAARPGARRAIQVAERSVASLCQETETADGRCHPVVATQGRTASRDVHLAPPTSGDDDPYGVGRFSGEAVDQAPASPSKRPVHVPGSTRSSLRQHLGRASHSPSRDHPQEQLRQPQRSRS